MMGTKPTCGDRVAGAVIAGIPTAAVVYFTTILAMKTGDIPASIVFASMSSLGASMFVEFGANMAGVPISIWGLRGGLKCSIYRPPSEEANVSYAVSNPIQTA